MDSRDEGGLVRLLGDTAWIETFGRMLLRSVRFADSLDQGRWGVTADEGRVNLNVGTVQTLTAHADELVINVSGDEPPQPGLRGVRVDTISPYKSLSRIGVSHLIVVATKGAAGRAFEALWARHADYIREASRTPRNPRTQRGHNQAFLQELGALIREPFPSPSYVGGAPGVL